MINPYSEYKKKSVTTMTPVEVVIRLYNEIERQLAIAISACEETPRDIMKAGNAFIKAQECLEALTDSLDRSIPISSELLNYYVFFNRTIIKANISKDCTEVRKIIPLIGELRDAFTQISQMTRQQIEEQDAQNNSKKQRGVV